MLAQPVSPVRAPVHARAPAAPERRGQPHRGALLAAQLGDARRLGREQDHRLRPGEWAVVLILNKGTLTYFVR